MSDDIERIEEHLGELRKERDSIDDSVRRLNRQINHLEDEVLIYESQRDKLEEQIDDLDEQLIKLRPLRLPNPRTASDMLREIKAVLAKYPADMALGEKLMLSLNIKKGA